MPRYYIQIKRTSSGKIKGFIPSKKNASKIKIKKELSKTRRKGLSYKILTESQFKNIATKLIIERAKKKLRSRAKTRTRRIVKRSKRK